MSSSAAPAAPLMWTTPRRRGAFHVFAWLVLAYNIPVILWGAYVRVSYSGDGCGNHWPFCNGQVIPRGMKLPTIIEFAHRMTTTVDSILVIALCVWGFLSFPKKHAVRTYSILSLLFLLIEAALGAGLVLFRMVAKDQSAGRGWYLSAHLTNTLLLLGVLVATAWLAGSNTATLRLRNLSTSIWMALAVTVFVGVTGAIAALGDTLFPAASLAAGLRQEMSSGSPALLRLRMLHPVLAVTGAAYLLLLCAKILKFDRAAPERKAATALAGITILQLAAGMANLSLLAPVWMQLTHLLIADLMWVAVVVLALESLRTAKPASAFTGM